MRLDDKRDRAVLLLAAPTEDGQCYSIAQIDCSQPTAKERSARQLYTTDCSRSQAEVWSVMFVVIVIARAIRKG